MPLSADADIEHSRDPLRRPPDRAVAAAVIVIEDGRYLLQLRDEKPGIPLPGHWALFGGGIEPDETPAMALVRELHEELGFRADNYRRLAEAIYRMPSGRLVEMWFFLVRVSREEIDRMVQMEGAGKDLFSIDQVMTLPRISPWDLSALLFHARADSLFPTADHP
jgi:8-oxo-dGTP pyrophosphatase MutT (NUDIX family)